MYQDVEVVLHRQDILGEGPLWNEQEGRLYWTDIEQGLISAVDPDRPDDVREWRVRDQVGCFAFAARDRLVLATRSGFHSLDRGSGEVTALIDPEPDQPRNRFNDGKCDAAGRFFAGTVHDDQKDPVGSLYRLDADGSVARVLSGLVCSNGIGWSPDNSVIYITDSRRHHILRAPYDLRSGEIGDTEIWVEDDPANGLSDGLAVDADGFVWSAKWDGWRVVRYSPTGEVDRVLQMPVPRATSCAFGGDDYRTLYITSARYGLSEEILDKAPYAGSVFRIRVDVPGLPATAYAG